MISLLLALLLPCNIAQRRWHAYDATKAIPKTEQCRDFDHEHANTNVSHVIDEYKLWPHALPSSHTFSTPNATIYGIGHAMKEIWQRQHPKDCSKAKFLISGYHLGGIGSVLHVFAAPLGLTMDLNRVYLQNPFNYNGMNWEWNVPFCKEHSPTSHSTLDCYFEPWSSCTIYDALGPNALNILQSIAPGDGRQHPNVPKEIFEITEGSIENLNNLQTKDIDKLIDKYSQHRVLFIRSMTWFRNGVVPFAFRSLLACSPMRSTAEYYWWRAISVTYITRPKQAVVKWLHNNSLRDLDSYRSHKHSHQLPSYVSVYVRRGDKAVEMHLVPVSRYSEAIDMLYDKGLVIPRNSHHHKSSQRIIFVASEDSRVMKEMTDWSQARNYSMYSTNLFDRSGLYAELTNAQRRQHDGIGMIGRHKGPPKAAPKPVAVAFTANDHHVLEYLSMLLNIHHLIQAEGFVCTMASNFCRLVDELRATIGGRADRPYLDLSEETCGGNGHQPPCLDQIKDFDW